MKTMPCITLLITSLMCSSFLYADDSKHQYHGKKHSSHQAHDKMGLSDKKLNKKEQYGLQIERADGMGDDESMGSKNIHKHPSAQDRLRDKD